MDTGLSTEALDSEIALWACSHAGVGIVPMAMVALLRHGGNIVKIAFGLFLALVVDFLCLMLGLVSRHRTSRPGSVPLHQRWRDSPSYLGWLAFLIGGFGCLEFLNLSLPGIVPALILMIALGIYWKVSNMLTNIRLVAMGRMGFAQPPTPHSLLIMETAIDAPYSISRHEQSDINMVNLTMLILILLAFAFWWSPAVAQQGDIVGVHDPSIIKSGDTFYLFSTHNGLEMRTSTDLINWKFVGPALPTELPEWASGYIRDWWAPDISFFNGIYHLYYAIPGDGCAVIALATNKTLNRGSPDYRWEDRGPIIRTTKKDIFMAIDPNVVFDQNYQPWLCHGAHHGGIRIARINPKTGKLTGPHTTIAHRPSDRIEAPFIIRRGAYYYLFVSFDQCCNGVQSTYRIMVGRSSRIQGPYLDEQGRPMMEGGGTLVLGTQEHVIGPGHNSVLRDLGQDYLVHHFYDGMHQGRHTLQIRPMRYSPTGWPVVGAPIDEDQSHFRGTASPPSPKSQPLSYQHYVNDNPAFTITILPKGRIAEHPTASWSQRGSYLEFRWPREDGKPPHIDRLHLSPDRSYYVGHNQDGVSIRGTRLP